MPANHLKLTAGRDPWGSAAGPMLKQLDCLTNVVQTLKVRASQLTSYPTVMSVTLIHFKFIPHECNKIHTKYKKNQTNYKLTTYVDKFFLLTSGKHVDFH